MAQTFTFRGITVTQADAQRVSEYIKALPPGPVGEARLEWERSNPRSGTAFYAAEIFASNLGLLQGRPFATNAVGQEIGASGGGTSFSYIAPNIQTPPRS